MPTKAKTTEAAASDVTKTDTAETPQVDGSEQAGSQTDAKDTTPATADAPASPTANAPASPGAAGGGDNEPVVVKAEDEIDSSVYDTSGSADEYVTLNKDVVEEFYYPDTKRPSHRLLFTKGQVVRKAQIDALNANVEARRAVVRGEVDESNPAGIDSTTLASQGRLSDGPDSK